MIVIINDEDIALYLFLEQFILIFVKIKYEIDILPNKNI